MDIPDLSHTLIPSSVFALAVMGMIRMKLIFNWEVLHDYYVAKQRMHGDEGSG